VSATSPEGAIWDALRGAIVTRAVAVVADLRVADAIGDGRRHVDELARDVGADGETLYRLLRALASDGIFAERDPRVFANTPSSDVLRGDGWRDFAHLFGGAWQAPIAALDASGRPTFEELHGAAFWSWLAAHPDERAAFDRAMEQGWESRLERLDSVDWRGDETIVDVGGGNGSLLLALLGRRPGLHGVVFDRPETVRDESAFGERCRFEAGDFFERVPAGDAYVLSTVLHDWDDASALCILRTIRAAAAPGTRLVLLESTIEAGNSADGSKWLDLLLLALFDGRERDEAQWRALLGDGGFEVERLGGGVIEARCR
jgi:O-methyltransferase domain